MAKDSEYSFGVEDDEVAAEIARNVGGKEESSSWERIRKNALYVGIMLVVFLIVLFSLGAIFQGGALFFVLTIAITGGIGKALRDKMFG